MYVILWTYEAAAGAEEAFVAAYGPNGAWAELFKRAEGFLGVELFLEADGRYLTIDRWSSEAAFQKFQSDHGEAYRALDVALAGLTVGQTRLGAFTGV